MDVGQKANVAVESSEDEARHMKGTCGEIQRDMVQNKEAYKRCGTEVSLARKMKWNTLTGLVTEENWSR